MTEKPTTLSLDSTEWRGLLVQNLVRAHEFAQGTQAIDAAQVSALHGHMDRMKALVTAWHNSQPAPVAEVGKAAPEFVPTPAQGNGAAPKKTGGWPKGRKRKQPLGAQAVQ